MQPYGYNQGGGWAWPQGQGPPQPPGPPVMVYQGMPNGGGPYSGQPGYGFPPRGRGRGRGAASDGASQNLVTRVKAELQVARPGQVLELARFAASQLANRSPVLYQQLLAGLLAGDQSVKTEPEEKVTRSLVVADRKAKWRELCAGDPDVVFWQQCQDTIKAQYGANAEVDSLIAEDDSKDIRKYLRGKKRREELLAESGLAREGSTLIPLVGEDTDSQLGGQPLNSHASGAKSSAPVGNNPEMAGILHLLTQLVLQQAGGAKSSQSQPVMEETKTAPSKPSPPQGGPSKGGSS